MNTPSIPRQAPPPAPSPQMQDEAVLAARQNEKRREMALYGRRSTILTGTGVGNTNLSKPTLLGASGGY